MSTKELYDLGDQPPLGEVPPKMHAFMVRQDRFGKPIDAWKSEVIDVPTIGPKDVLVYVMATGINYNNVWAALGYPCLLYTSPSPRDTRESRIPSSA